MIKKIKIGPVDYAIKMLPKDTTDQYGACVYDHQIIYLSPNQLHQGASDTLLHEVLHAIWHEAGIEHNEIIVEETVVRTLSTWLRIIFRDNPALVKFIVDSEKEWPHKPTTDPLEVATE